MRSLNRTIRIPPRPRLRMMPPRVRFWSASSSTTDPLRSKPHAGSWVILHLLWYDCRRSFACNSECSPSLPVWDVKEEEEEDALCWQARVCYIGFLFIQPQFVLGTDLAVF